ncbi:hypothetical protein JHK87_055152 [Glycine soja]|nr:hypothetical protein JHK87_055152 [Glycine soja]
MGEGEGGGDCVQKNATLSEVVALVATSLEILAKKLARQLDFTGARAPAAAIGGCFVIAVVGTNCEGWVSWGRKRTPSLLVETLRARLTQMPLLSLHGTARNACRQIMPSVPIVNQGCPSKIGILVIVLLGLYIIAYAPGMGTVPWVLNSEIYLLRYRGLGGGIVAVSNWCANLIMSESFLSMTESLGTTNIFLLVVGFSLVVTQQTHFSLLLASRWLQRS